MRAVKLNAESQKHHVVVVCAEHVKLKVKETTWVIIIYDFNLNCKY